MKLYECLSKDVNLKTRLYDIRRNKRTRNITSILFLQLTFDYDKPSNSFSVDLSTDFLYLFGQYTSTS